MHKIAIVIQGETSYLTEQRIAWNSFIDDIIFSTWEKSRSLYEEKEKVCFSELPSNPGPANFFLQKITTLKGLMYAKELGYTYALKIRADLLPTNADALLSLFDLNKLNFLCWHNHMVYNNCPGYLVDYLMAGPIDTLIDLWDIDEAFCAVPEIMLTWSYIQKIDLELLYFLNLLDKNNDLLWKKPSIYLSSYQTLNIPDPFKKYTFSEDKQYLTLDYLNFLK